MINRFFLLFFAICLLTNCNSSFSLEGPGLSLYSWSGLTWTWLESREEESALKTVIYEEQFGEGNNLRLNQSMSIFGDKAFCFNHGNECKVLDLRTKEWLLVDKLPDKSHHNNAQFLNAYYEKGDKYPLLLLSQGDYPPNQNDLYVVRVTEDDQIISFTVVKTIHNCLQEAKYNGSWVADEVHGRLFLYTMTSGDWRVKENNRFCVFSFLLPDLLDVEDVTLGYENVLDKWEYTYLIHQGGTYYHGYLFFNVQSLTSVDGKSVVCPKSVIAINAANGRVDTILPLDDNKETEGICVNDNRLYVCFKNGSENQASTGTVFTLSQYTLPASIIKGN